MINLLKYLVLPPTGNTLLALLGLLLIFRKWTKTGAALILAAISSLVLLSMPVVSHQLTQPLEKYPPLSLETAVQQQAIIVLGGGRSYSGKEFGWPDAPSEASISRLSYAAWLHRKTGLPLLLAGGTKHGEELSEALLMQRMLVESFGVKARWLEERSRNTNENAIFSADLLQKQNIDKVILVSHAWHLARAVPAFESEGLDTLPAPLQFSTPPPSGLIGWIPRAYHLEKSTMALHEYMGRVVYSLLSS
ncbi:MAG: YdcF family protein [Thiohalophilus sp.]|uniref:YdcF family protein n=1 Tax=Thiohalophilus sp. TaxID=3028392 RepID=UPI00286FECEB|nr:YdcF family protein [Thiohalophilus sp.]MDR9437822.1 YdcF family protein [Thiohalophilus sp.]